MDAQLVQLAGGRSYAAFSAPEPAVVPAGGAAHVTRRRRSLNLGQEFADRGVAYSELDDDGNVVRRDPHARP